MHYRITKFYCDFVQLGLDEMNWPTISHSDQVVWLRATQLTGTV